VLFRWRWRLHEPESGLRVSLPRNWEARPGNVRKQQMCTAYQFVKDESWWWGAGTPQEVRAWIVVGAPGVTDAAMTAAVEEAFRDLLMDTRRFPEFGSFQQDGVETWISHGNYQISPLHNPKKVIFQRSVDGRRRLAFVVRVYEERISLSRLREIRCRLFQSVVLAAG
jgi:hypothetical protein